jgi:hypothetical protein
MRARKPFVRLKHFLLLIAACFAFNISHAQDELEGGVYAEHFQLGYRSQENFGGILHIPIGAFTLNYQIGLGPKSGGGLYVHAPVGCVVGAWMLGNFSNFRFLTLLGALSIAVPEGVGVYLSEGDKISTHLSVNPLGFDYWYRRDEYEEIGRMSGSVVFRVKMRTNLDFPAYIAPQLAATMIYRADRENFDQFGFRAGVTFGIE